MKLFFACEQNFYSIKCFNFHFLILISYLVQHFFFWLVRFALFLCRFLQLFSRSFASFSGWFDVQDWFANWFIFLFRLVTLCRLGWGLPCLTAKVTVTVISTLVIGTCILGAMINDIRAIWSSYKMIAYIMIFVHNDRLQTVHDDIQAVKIDI